MTLTEQFTLEELQHIMGVLNSWDCPECSEIRRKVESMIKEYKPEVVVTTPPAFFYTGKTTS